ncbi:MAG: hypothetical protein IJ214_07150 [Clostridia bacterium]|nr:hypothetical protein [Clostridia bacterium]
MKKLIAILLTLVMTLSLATAFAAPSKTSSDVAAVESPAVEAEPEEELKIAFAKTAEAEEELEKIAEFVKDGADIAEYFPEEIAEQLKGENLQLAEFTALSIDNYDPEMGDLPLVFRFDTQFKEGEKIFVLVALFDAEGNVEWVLVDAENIAVAENGDVTVTFPAELLEKMGEAKSVAVAVLNEKAQ